jgi:hypothetical protein
MMRFEVDPTIASKFPEVRIGVIEVVYGDARRVLTRRWNSPDCDATKRSKPFRYTPVTTVDLIHSPRSADPATPVLVVHNP